MGGRNLGRCKKTAPCQVRTPCQRWTYNQFRRQPFLQQSRLSSRCGLLWVGLQRQTWRSSELTRGASVRWRRYRLLQRVVLFTYDYNATDFHTTLLRRLRSRGRSPFEVVLAVDAEKFKKNRPLLTQLVEKGAQVFRCEGEKDTARYGPEAYAGSLHMKALVIDGRIAYCGSANFTEASKKNLEMMIRIVGAPVRDILPARAGYLYHAPRNSPSTIKHSRDHWLSSISSRTQEVPCLSFLL